MRGSLQLRPRQIWISLTIINVLVLCGYYLHQTPHLGRLANIELPFHKADKPQTTQPPSPSPSAPPPPAKPNPSEPKPAPPKPAKPTPVPPPDAEGSPKNYTRALVVASLLDEDTAWVEALAHNDPNLTGAVYAVDDSNATYSVPANKGHEVMVYLTYIIDHYETLPDVMMFMHYHMLTWHNNDFLDANSAHMVKHLRSEKVIRDGYMNLRCHHKPGCPDHIHPTTEGDDLLNIPEAAVIGKSWSEIFPDTDLPEVLSQPCCGQFALSRDRIRSKPLEKYIYYRDWVLKTRLDDQLSGRVWEYLWQYVFAGVEEFCPEEHICYCEGYGVCFDGKEEYDYYFEMREESRDLGKEIESLKSEDGSIPSESEDKVHTMEDRITFLKQKMAKIKDRVAGDL